MKILILMVLLVCSSAAFSGNGAGGRIIVFNRTGETVYVTWSGTFCSGSAYELFSVCALQKLGVGGMFNYGYGWGVTNTWINVSSSLYATRKTQWHRYTQKKYLAHPCQHPITDGCLVDHHSVTTSNSYSTRCTLTKPGTRVVVKCDH